MIEIITIEHKGNFNNTDRFFKGILASNRLRILEKYAKRGVIALSSATPVDSGKTSKSWGYEVKHYKGGESITWTNSNVVDGVPIAIIIQYGHATKNGGYVEGRDYINPTLRPIFDEMAKDVWKEVTNL